MGNWPSWTPGIARTPASRTASAPANRAAWASSRPSYFHINAAWLELALAATDLLAWTRTGLLADEPDLARAEPRLLRYRMLHTAARITRGSRRIWLRLAEGWPWALALARAFELLRRIPLPT